MGKAPLAVALMTICLNEMEWLEKLYANHCDWPGLVRWSFVESCDLMYYQASRSMATSNGLSVDGTSEFLARIARQDSRTRYVPLGFVGHDDRALGKIQCKARALAELTNATRS